MLLVEGEEVGVLQVGVKFYLVDCGDDFCGFEDGLEVWDEVVGDADGFCGAASLDLFEGGPGGLEF